MGCDSWLVRDTINLVIRTKGRAKHRKQAADGVATISEGSSFLEESSFRRGTFGRAIVTALVEVSMATIPQWKIEADYLESCNCEFGCPCNFSGWPTGGRCETLIGYHIRNGNYGAVQLDGLVYAASCPRAIHQGGGTMRVYIDERGLAEQRAALTE